MKRRGQRENVALCTKGEVDVNKQHDDKIHQANEEGGQNEREAASSTSAGLRGRREGRLIRTTPCLMDFTSSFNY